MAKEMMDVLMSEEDDLVVIGGDFIIAESTGQHQKHLILNNKGDFKQNPTICAAVPTYVDDETVQNIVRAVSIEFARDGMEVRSIIISASGIIESDAFYE